MSGEDSDSDIFEASGGGFSSTEVELSSAYTDEDAFFFESTNQTTEIEYFYPTSKAPESVIFSPEAIAFGGICLIIISTVAVVANFISILALSNSKRLRRVTTAFIVNLCVANFFLSCFSLLSSVAIYRTKHWNGGFATCRFYSIVMYFFTVMSMFTVTMITLNRYILIVHPQFYQALFRVRNTAIIISLLWILPLVLTLLPLLKVWGMFGYDPKTGECAIIDQYGNSEIYMFIIAYFVPFILFILCYAKIFFVVRKIERNTTRRRGNILSYMSQISDKYWHEECKDETPETSCKHLHNEKEFRLFKIILVIYVCYILCFIPLAIMKILQKEKELPTLYIVFHLGLHLSNVINPIIYVVMSKEYRRAYKELLC